MASASSHGRRQEGRGATWFSDLCRNLYVRHTVSTERDKYAEASEQDSESHNMRSDQNYALFAGLLSKSSQASYSLRRHNKIVPITRLSLRRAVIDVVFK